MRNFATVRLDDLCNMLGIEKEDFMRLVPAEAIKGPFPFPPIPGAMFEEESDNDSPNHDDALEFLYDQRKKEDLKFQIQKSEHEMRLHVIETFIKSVKKAKDRDQNINF